MSKHDEAIDVARKLLELELIRLETTNQQKQLKEELMQIFLESDVDTSFNFNQGTVYLDTTESYEIPNGLKEILELKVTRPDKINPELVGKYLEDGVKLNKIGKKALKESLDPDLASMIIIKEKESIKIKVG